MHLLTKSLGLFLCLFFLIQPAKAQEASSDTLDLQAILALTARLDSLQWQTGTITIGDALATMTTPEGFRFLGPNDTKYILTDLWGNPKEASDDALGMLFPENQGPLSDSTVGFVISFEKLGFVKDDDAADMDFKEIMDNMKKESAEANEQRKSLGYGTVDMIGWASEPYYDKDKKTIHWAKEIRFDGAEENTLNYDARILGRRGVLSINAVGKMRDLPVAKAMMPKLLDQTAFTSGNRYEDFDNKIDDVAAWTIGGLVAGKILAKTGFFVLILKFIKPILLAVGLGGSAVWKYITGRRRKEEEEDQPDLEQNKNAQ
jgi:uncharacterized membrane-anchored protein